MFDTISEGIALQARHTSYQGIARNEQGIQAIKAL
jgi:hypothetical protein